MQMLRHYRKSVQKESALISVFKDRAHQQFCVCRSKKDCPSLEGHSGDGIGVHCAFSVRTAESIFLGWGSGRKFLQAPSIAPRGSNLGVEQIQHLPNKCSLDLRSLFPYSGGHACSSFPQVLRGVLQKMWPRCLSRNGRLPSQRHMRRVLSLRRETAVPAFRSHARQAAWRDTTDEKAWSHTRSSCAASAAGYCGKGASLIVLPSRAD
jgi:hypothetical protein